MSTDLVKSNASEISEYLKRPEAILQFAEIMGAKEAKAYIKSVLIVVMDSPELMKCTPRSILKSALRAATLKLSCDPAMKQAWIVPYNKNIGTRQSPQWVKEAQFQPHYYGLYNLAMRTRLYTIIHVHPIYAGQRVLENPLTGLHSVMEEDTGIVGKPTAYLPGLIDVTTRRKKDLTVIGWLGYLEGRDGSKKSVYMSIAEIDDHARTYVKEYEKNPNWNDPNKRPTMEMKTVLRQLLNWTDKSSDTQEERDLSSALNAEESPETIEGETHEDEGETSGMSYDTAKGIIVKTKTGEREIGSLDAESLNRIIENSVYSEEQKKAALVVLVKDFGFESPKKSREENMKELGFGE